MDHRFSPPQTAKTHKISNIYFEHITVHSIWFGLRAENFDDTLDEEFSTPSIVFSATKTFEWFPDI